MIQIKLLDSHYDDVLAKNAWVFGDVAITYADVTEGQPYVTQLEIGKLSENVSVAGASFDGAPRRSGDQRDGRSLYSDCALRRYRTVCAA